MGWFHMQSSIFLLWNFLYLGNNSLIGNLIINISLLLYLKLFILVTIKKKSLREFFFHYKKFIHYLQLYINLKFSYTILFTLIILFAIICPYNIFLFCFMLHMDLHTIINYINKRHFSLNHSIYHPYYLLYYSNLFPNNYTFIFFLK